MDEELTLFRYWPLDDATCAYLWFDGTYEQVRKGGRIVSQTVVIVGGARETGEKCNLGAAVAQVLERLEPAVPKAAAM
jgi:transposase-like protein